jgi:predicted HTH transcriptional regulator
MAEDIIKNQLDTIISLLKLAHRDALDAARRDLNGDGVSAAVLERTATEAVGAGTLKKEIAKATGQSEKTVQRRIAELLGMGAVVREGSGPNTAYKATGLI